MGTVVFANQKGGVGKTTSALALASGLAAKGYKVLAVDLDPQCNLTLASGSDSLEDPTIYDVFAQKENVADVVKSTKLGFDLLPSSLALAAADMEFTATGKEFMLAEALEELSKSRKWDHVVIDTSPNIGVTTVNGLTAADGVVVAMTADVYALQGLSRLNDIIMRTRKYCNPKLKIFGLLITKYSQRQVVSRTLLDQIQRTASEIGTKVFNTHIRESVAIRESALLQQNMFEEAPKANAVVDYGHFIDEILQEMSSREA